MTQPDFRALCAVLVDKLDELNCNFNIPSQSALIERVNDALATPPPEPGKVTAWMYQGEDDFDGKRWRENWEVTIDEKLARFKSGNKEPIPLFKAHDSTPTPEPPTVSDSMTDFSPAAQAVLNAWSKDENGVYLEGDPERLAAAIRAAADQVVPWQPEPTEDSVGPTIDYGYAWALFSKANDVRQELIAIADELEGHA